MFLVVDGKFGYEEVGLYDCIYVGVVVVGRMFVICLLM